MIKQPKRPSTVKEKIRHYETRTLFDLNEYFRDIHKEIVKQLEKRGYLIFKEFNETNH